MLRLLACLGLLVATACTNSGDLDREPAYLGNFHLGHNVVVAPNLTRGAASRAATEAEWTGAVKRAIDDRFSRYEGTRLYHLGVSLEGYVLAYPGIPVVASPKSALILKITVWDDAAGAKLNAEPEILTVVENVSPETFIGSGLTRSREQQIDALSRNAAKTIETWLKRQNDTRGWFEDDGRPAREKIGLISGRPPDTGSAPEAAEPDARPAAQ